MGEAYMSVKQATLSSLETLLIRRRAATMPCYLSEASDREERSEHKEACTQGRGERAKIVFVSVCPATGSSTSWMRITVTRSSFIHTFPSLGDVSRFHPGAATW